MQIWWILQSCESCQGMDGNVKSAKQPSSLNNWSFPGMRGHGIHDMAETRFPGEAIYEKNLKIPSRVRSGRYAKSSFIITTATSESLSFWPCPFGNCR